MQPPPTVSLDVSGLKADGNALDMLARLALQMRRCGYDIRLRHPSQELRELIELAGLSQTLPVEGFRPGPTEPGPRPPGGSPRAS